MKNIHFLLLFFLPFFSCKKHKEAEINININIPVGTIIAKIDGLETTFNVDAIAETDTIQLTYYEQMSILDISGKKDSAGNSKKIKISIFVVPPLPIEIGIYPNRQYDIGNYIYYTDTWTYSLNSYKPYYAKTTIVKKDSVVQGVFSGYLIIGTGPGINEPQPPLAHRITDGMFHVRLR